MTTQQAKCITVLSHVGVLADRLAGIQRDAGCAWCWCPLAGAGQGSRP
ncbi:MAG: hypothetical protein ACRDRU_22060 [Pseudonocardiaceae bacterium]